jgi:low temperature requirement protein LtrA
VAVDYTAPMHGFAAPFLGRSLAREWTIDGGYLAERFQLFVIITFGSRS